MPAYERRRSRRDGLPRRPHRRTPPGPDAAPATAVPHRRPDLRRRPVGLPAAADQRRRPGAARVHRDPPDRQPRRPGHDRGVSRAAPPQGGPGDRSLLHQRRPPPPALLRRAAGDAPAGVEPLGVAPADHRGRGVRAVHEGRGEPPVGLGDVLQTAAGRSGPGRSGEVEAEGRAWLHRGPQARRDLPGRCPPGRSGAGQHGHLHDLRRPRGHRRLVPVAVLAVAGDHRAVRPGDRPQRLRRLCGVPGLGQRPVGVHPHRPEPQAEERGAARHPRLGRDRRGLQHDHHREAGAAAGPHATGDRP